MSAKLQFNSTDFQSQDSMNAMTDKLGQDSYLLEDLKVNPLKSAANVHDAGEFWLFIVVYISKLIKNKYKTKLERTEAISRIFSYDFLKLVFIHSSSYIDSNLRWDIHSAYPKLQLTHAIKQTAHQAYHEQPSSDLFLKVFDTLDSIKFPFNDARFSVEAIHTDCSVQGLTHSDWLINLAGGYKRHWCKDSKTKKLFKVDCMYRAIYMDAKLGLLFFFKNKPCFHVSFNFDSKGNIFIHQIQAELKGRGHYTLGTTWRTQVIKFVSNLFPEKNIYLIDGDNAVKNVINSYGHDTEEFIKPDKETQNHIAQSYNMITGMFNRRRNKNGTLFRRII